MGTSTEAIKCRFTCMTCERSSGFGEKALTSKSQDTSLGPGKLPRCLAPRPYMMALSYCCLES